jgi:ABC-2 type transport system permease protein
VIAHLVKLRAFLIRDLRSEVSYRVSFLFQLAGMFFSVAGFYFASKMVNPATEGLDGIPPFPWLMVGLAFQYYFATALYSFSSRIRNEQVIGTLEAMLVSPTPTAIVIFSSAVWDFTYGAIRVIVYLLFATLVFGVQELQGDVLRLAILTAILLPLGLLFSKVAIQRAKREGSLVHY